MEIREILYIVTQSREFKDFEIEHPNSYFVSAFFVFSISSKQDTKDTYQINFCFEEDKEKQNKKAAIFSYDKEKSKINVEISNFVEKKESLNLTEIKKSAEINTDEIKQIIFEQLKLRNINKIPVKIILSLNAENTSGSEQELIWSSNCFFENLDLIKILINDKSREIKKFEKLSLMDMIKKKSSK